MINQIGGFEEIGEKIQDTTQSAAKSAQQGTKNFVNSTKGQIAGSQSQPQVPSSDQGSNEVGNAAQKQMSDDQAKQFLKDLYGPTNPKGDDKNSQFAQSSNQNPLAAAIGLAPQDPNAGKSPEEVAQMAALRKTLHEEYYHDLTTPQKAEEENAVERNEREDEEKKIMEFVEQQKKPAALPSTVKQGTGESVVGASG